MAIETITMLVFLAAITVPAIISSLVQMSRDKKKGCSGKCKGCEYYDESDGTRCRLGIEQKGFAKLYHGDKNKYE